MIKLIATDLDSTLLTREKIITEESAALLRVCSRMGVGFAIATGRSLGSARGIARAAGVPYTAICYNGSLVMDPEAGEVISESFLDEATVRDVIDYCRSHDLYVQLYIDHVIIVEKLMRERHNDPDLDYAGWREVGDFFTCPSLKTPKILIAAGADRVPVVQADMERVFGDRVYMAQSAAHLIEVMPKGVDKGFALEALSRHLGIGRESIIAFGDNTNDLPLLKAAGTGVAVANAVPGLKAEADYVASKERDRGFNEGLMRFVFGMK